MLALSNIVLLVGKDSKQIRVHISSNMPININQIFSLFLFVVSFCDIVIDTSCKGCHKRKHFKGLERISSDYKNERYHLPDSDMEETLKSVHHRIAGGYTAREGEFPSFVGLFGFGWDGRSFQCSGVAISEELVLTAAHCYNGRDWIVRAAATIWAPVLWDLKGVETYKVVQSCVSKKYQDTAPFLAYDYRVLRLERPIKGIDFALLPTEEVPIGFHAISVGTGITYSDKYFNVVYPDSLQALPVQRVRCWPSFGGPTRMCFQQYQNKYRGAACQGDSGGPVYGEKREGKDVVVALTSFGSGECHKNSRAMVGHADLYDGLNEIRKMIEECSSNK